MIVKFKKLDETAIIPTYIKPGDGALDLTATSKIYSPKEDSWIYGTGLAAEIPPGFVGLVFPRSSIYKTNFFLPNAVGVVDSGYRGEIKIVFKTVREGSIYHPNNSYFVGDRVAQLMILPYPQITAVEVDELSETDRGAGGWGSTGQ